MSKINERINDDGRSWCKTKKPKTNDAIAAIAPMTGTTSEGIQS
jgi:hypothetical protein